MTAQPSPPIRATFYIDGFNLDHGLREHTKARSYRWLNLWSLAQNLLTPGHVLSRVVYFTAVPPWSASKSRRHQTYVDALKTLGIEVVAGRFQKDQRRCHAACGQFFDVYTEKLTDVHIATSILRDGVAGSFDWAYLMSGDADQAPTIRTLHDMAPGKRVHVILPPRRESAELRQVADRCTGPLNHRRLKGHLLPDALTIGSRIIQRPSDW